MRAYEHVFMTVLERVQYRNNCICMSLPMNYFYSKETDGIELVVSMPSVQ